MPPALVIIDISITLRHDVSFYDIRYGDIMLAFVTYTQKG